MPRGFCPRLSSSKRAGCHWEFLCPCHLFSRLFLGLLSVWLGTWLDVAAAAEQFEYAVEVAPDNPDGEGVRKSARLVVVWDESQQHPVTWVLDDEDSRGVVWQERFGTLGVPEGTHAGVPGPSLKLAWEEAEYQVPVLVVGPLPGGMLTVGQMWDAGGLAHEVTEQRTSDKIQGWVVRVRGRIGQKRVVTVDSGRGQVLDLRETFFIGQGKRHELAVRLLHRQRLDDNALAAWKAAWEQVSQLRAKSGWESDGQARQAANTADLRQELRRLLDSPGQPPAWQRLMQIAARQMGDEQIRQQGLDNARRKALAQTLPQLKLESITGKVPAQEDLQNHVVVLHFWDYRDAPLHEPYGQVGYLDFLYRKYSPQGVHVIGMVTNQFSDSPAGRKTAALSARKFAAFMNLAYPVAQDGGELLRRIGDPRTFDGSLPLFVVADKKGRIIHYRAGYYPVDTQQGLVELEQVIRQALQSAP